MIWIYCLQNYFIEMINILILNKLLERNKPNSSRDITVTGTKNSIKLYS